MILLARCSNLNDITIYDDTKSTLTSTSTNCAMLSFFGSSGVRECFDDKVGFTPGCNDCWVENVMCDLRSCVFTCLKMMLTGRKGKNNGDGGELNDCLRCDEQLCGPEFIRCAGANRRRAGIKSAIGRDEEEEVCKEVEEGWRDYAGD